jgi:3-phosphoshikimate 1-carboxyvinyltransferase
MVMAAALLGLVVPGVVVEDVGTVAKTLPDFTTRWEQMVSGGPATP